VTPTHGRLLDVGDVRVFGTCIFRPSGDWILVKQAENRFWPEGDIEFDHTGTDWSAKLWLAPDTSVFSDGTSRPARFL
jgi:hypothetical protein